MNKTVVVSGGFDPIHVGHLRMFQEAAKLGSLTVVINTDEWLLRKKNYVFMPWEERAEIISAFVWTMLLLLWMMIRQSAKLSAS